MPYGTLNTGTITPGSGNTLTIDETVDGTAIKDEDAMGSNSATHLATQQSIKAYVDTTGTNSSITTLGTVSAGTWEATDVAVAHGGTGASTHTANNVLIGAGTSALTSIAPGSDGQVLTSTGSVWQSEAAATSHTGHVIQYDSSLITTVTSTDVAIPSDNTKPQITEGATMVSLAFTPLFAGSTLEILVNVGMDSNESSNLALCLFNTAIHATDAVVVAASRTGGGLSQSMTILHNYTTPSTATATWQVRYGGHYGIVKIGQTNSFNYGSIMQYGITIKEIKV